MNTRGIIGRRIVAVRQHRWHDERTGRTEWIVQSLLLDNGEALIAHGIETECDGPIGTLLRKRTEGSPPLDS